MKRSLLWLPMAVIAVMACPAVASAATSVSVNGGTLVVRGGPEANNVSIGFAPTRIEDTGGLLAGAGCVQVSATRADCGWGWSVDAALGEGNDRFSNSSTATSGMTAVVLGEGGDDTLGGWEESDTLVGGPGNDTISASGGTDRLEGGPGDDDLNGGGGNDTLDGGAGRDRVAGDGSLGYEDGNDTILIRDGEVDQASCGLGADLVTADPGDVVDLVDCDSIDRKSAPAPTPTPGPVNPGTDSISVGVLGPQGLRIRTLLSRGARIWCYSTGDGAGTLRLIARGAQARKLGRRGTVVLASTTTALFEDGEKYLRLRPKPQYRAALRRQSRITLYAELIASSGLATDTDLDDFTVKR